MAIRSITILAKEDLWLYLTSIIQVSASIGQDEALAIVVSYGARDLERDAVRCIGEAVAKAYPSVRIVSPDEFRRAAFPDLPAETAPYSSEYLLLILNDARFLQRIAPLRLRYLISVSAATEQSVVGAGAGGAAGLIVWDRRTHFTAAVLDIKQAQPTGELRGSASGSPWVFIIGGVPLGVPSMTESQACEELGKSVTRFLGSGEEP